MEYEVSREERPSGWVKPQREPTLAELKAMIAETETKLLALKRQAEELEEGRRLEAIVQIRNIMRAQDLSIADIAKK
jgi:hypothetical protein